MHSNCGQLRAETNKFYHCIETDLFAAIFPTLSSIARRSRSVSILWTKYYFPYQQNWSEASKDGFLWYEEMGKEGCGIDQWRDVA
jgi:hypothetical protein